MPDSLAKMELDLTELFDSLRTEKELAKLKSKVNSIKDSYDVLIEEVKDDNVSRAALDALRRIDVELAKLNYLTGQVSLEELGTHRKLAQRVASLENELERAAKRRNSFRSFIVKTVLAIVFLTGVSVAFYFKVVKGIQNENNKLANVSRIDRPAGTAEEGR